MYGVAGIPGIGPARPSVADRAHPARVGRRVLQAKHDGRRVVAVVSAIGDTTDRLVSDYGAAPCVRELDALLALEELSTCAPASPAVQDWKAGGIAAGVTPGRGRPVAFDY
jgi:hypothetical protein